MKFYIYTLGCKVNTYESNVISELLEKENYSKVNDPKDADIVIVNTCTVTNTADNKSLKMIRQAHRINEKALIIVCGCMTQHEYNRIVDLDNVVIIIGCCGRCGCCAEPDGQLRKTDRCDPRLWRRNSQCHRQKIADQ